MTGPEQLDDWIARREFNYQEAARHLGLDPSVVTKLAKGRRGAGLDIALVIERKTGIPVEAWASVDPDTYGELVTTGRRNSK